MNPFLFVSISVLIFMIFLVANRRQPICQKLIFPRKWERYDYSMAGWHYKGISLAYTFNEAAAQEQHKIQYFEMFGNRGIYQDGWFARNIHRPA